MTPIQGISPVMPVSLDSLAPVGAADVSGPGGMDTLTYASGKANDVQVQAINATRGMRTKALEIGR